MESILVILALVVVLLIFVLRAIQEQSASIPGRESPSGLNAVTESLPDDDESESGGMFDEEVGEFVRKCIADHNAMTCAVRGQYQFLLPLSLDGDRLTAIPLDVASNADRRRRTLRLSSIRKPHVQALKPRECDLELTNVEVRGAVADATRQHTARIRKTVSRKTYAFLEANQNPRIFGLLESAVKHNRPISTS